MRFIDADSICVFGKYIKTNEKFEPYIMIDDLVKLLDEQPTAYDVDEVVKELEEKARTVNVIGYGTIYEAINKDVAIEIVKHGGVSDDVCEWWLCDEEANVYDTSCRNPHILIEGTPKENNYEYCPYCGKNIKVVE